MEDQRCWTRIIMRGGTGFAVLETYEDVTAQLRRDLPWIQVKSWGGSDLMPPETLLLAAAEILSVQAMSEESWIWTKHATELHYARQIRELETTPAELMARAQERLVDVLSGQDGGDD